MRVGIPLTKFLLEEQRNFPQSSGSFTSLFTDLIHAVKIISNVVNKAGLLNIIGETNTENIHGETVQKLDEYANNIIISTMESGGNVKAMASEEEVTIHQVPAMYHPKGNYIFAFDPLDGSSNIDCNISIGTIFSIYKVKNSEIYTEKDFLKQGLEQVCAGYVLYGSSTMLIYTTGYGVHGFTLDQSIGEFLLSHEDMLMPEEGNIYSVNEGNTKNWAPKIKKYVQACQKAEMRGRYVGSLVADFHRTLIKGGIFLYPGDKKNKNGKLRLLYEANPLAFIAEQAGGMATDGKKRILEVKAKDIHEKTPLIIGSKKDVTKFLKTK